MLNTEWGQFDSWASLAAFWIAEMSKTGTEFVRSPALLAEHAGGRAERRIAQGRGTESALGAMIEVIARGKYA